MSLILLRGVLISLSHPLLALACPCSPWRKAVFPHSLSISEPGAGTGVLYCSIHVEKPHFGSYVTRQCHPLPHHCCVMARWCCPWLTVSPSNITPALTHGYFIRHMNDPSNKLASGILEPSFFSDLVPLPSLPQPFLWPFPDLSLSNHPQVIQFHIPFFL